MNEIEGRAKSTGGTALIRRLPRNVWVVTITSFLTDISSEMLINLIPLFLSNVLGVRTVVIGLIETVATAAVSVLKLISGWLSDRLGVRKWLAVLGYGVSTVAKPFMYFATSWGWVLVVRFADRAGKGLRTAPRDAMVVDSVDEDQRGLAFGMHRAGDTLGALIGHAIAMGVVLAVQRGATTLARDTFQIVVLISVIPAALAVVVLALGAREVTRIKRQPTRLLGSGEEGRFSTTVFDRRFRLFLVIITLFTLGNSSDFFLTLRAQSAGLSVVGVLGVWIVLNLAYSLASTPAGMLSDRVGRRKLLIAGWTLYLLVYLGFALATSGWQVWVLMAAYGLYYGLSEGVTKAFVADLVPHAKRGTVYGVFNAAIGFAALPANLIAGALWQGVGKWKGFGPSAPFLYGAALALLAVVLLIKLPEEDASPIAE
jgi:MFS family permease